MKSAYEELSSFSAHQEQNFLINYSVISHLGLPKIQLRQRVVRHQLIDVNNKSSALARDLANFLEERSTLENKPPVTSNIRYHIANVIKEESRNNYHVQIFLGNPLRALVGQFDLKY